MAKVLNELERGCKPLAPRLRLVQRPWPIVTAGRRCETSKVLRRRSSETHYQGCRRLTSGDPKNWLIEPEADDRSNIFAICCRGPHEQRGRLLEALARPGCFSKEQWFRL
jgi:hypothetical protein